MLSIGIKLNELKAGGHCVPPFPFRRLPGVLMAVAPHAAVSDSDPDMLPRADVRRRVDAWCDEIIDLHFWYVTARQVGLPTDY